ncbi:acyl-CoA dehydrogenase family protein [Aeromicrobium halocynthiae]|uniref:Acyl-CoA dehydrogenase family protein n=1 Tax=Aeromicrobium halocynthiae TaxID=560557 RepID=A0ABN2VV03_9ACTN
MEQALREVLDEAVNRLLAEFPPSETDPADFLAARFDAGLAWVSFPLGCGGLEASHADQAVVEARLAAAGAPVPDPDGANGIGLGMAAPTIAAFGTEEQKQRFLRATFTGDVVWCQLFSEPGAGSDLAAVATRAVRDGDSWVVNGQKVWTSGAHNADFAILVARTDPDVPKHAGLTYFLCDMRVQGVDVRPLRQITGEAEFNEVFLTDVVIPDEDRLGVEGEGWKVANVTLNNERVAIGGHASRREDGQIGVLADRWREAPHLRNAASHDALLRHWVDAEATRLTAERLRQQLAVGQPGPEGATLKLAFATQAQAISGLGVELEAGDGLRFDDWTMRRPAGVSMTGRDTGYRYLRAKGNSIEGGTSEILRNVIAERVLGLPGEHRVDTTVPWKELPR